MLSAQGLRTHLGSVRGGPDESLDDARMKADEKQLLDRVLAHEEGAFDDFLERYRALIYSVFYGKGYGFPDDYMDDVYQSFVLALTAKDYHKLRAFQGRNNCSMATFLQVVASRFALDELRKFKRHPRGRGQGGGDDEDEPFGEVEDQVSAGPVGDSLDREQTDLFHNLLFSLEWKRVSVVLWVFRGVARETVADVMATSRANIDALYKRAKDQMTQAFADGDFSRARREPDPRLQVPVLADPMRRLLRVSPRKVMQALLVPGSKVEAVIGLIMVNYAEYNISLEELQRLAGDRDAIETAQAVLERTADALEV